MAFLTQSWWGVPHSLHQGNHKACSIWSTEVDGRSVTEFPDIHYTQMPSSELFWSIDWRVEARVDYFVCIHSAHPSYFQLCEAYLISDPAFPVLSFSVPWRQRLFIRICMCVFWGLLSSAVSFIFPLLSFCVLEVYRKFFLVVFSLSCSVFLPNSFNIVPKE